MIKFPKTPRLLQEPPAEWGPFTAVIEEKVDGANAAVSFEGSKLVLQSRGHVLSGGPREVQFDLFKQWAGMYRDVLYEVLGNRYVAFGEWLYAKHRLFYDNLPAWFLGFDVWDKERGVFLSTAKRNALTSGSLLVQVRQLHSDVFQKVNNFGQYIGISSYKTTNWMARFDAVMSSPVGRHYALHETDQTQLMEGVYVKVEDDEQVVGRMKLHRLGFEKVRMDDDKWLRRPIFPNQLGLQ